MLKISCSYHKINYLISFDGFYISTILDPRKGKRQEKTSAISTMSTTGNLTNEGDDGRIFDGKYIFKYENDTSLFNMVIMEYQFLIFNLIYRYKRCYERGSHYLHCLCNRNLLHSGNHLCLCLLLLQKKKEHRAKDG